MTKTKRPVDADSWDTETGLPDDFDFWISRSYFGYRPEYNSGKSLLLIWEGESPEYGAIGGSVDSQPIIWPVGQNWQPAANGSKVIHDKGKTRFVKSSIYGRLLDRVKSMGVDMSQYGHPTEADVWTDLGFHLIREELDFSGAQDRGILADKGGKTPHLMPTSFLGERQAEEKPQISEDVVAKLTELAKKSADVKKFQIAAHRIEGLTDEVMADILNSGSDGFYARVKAGK